MDEPEEEGVEVEVGLAEPSVFLEGALWFVEFILTDTNSDESMRVLLELAVSSLSVEAPGGICDE